MMARMPKSLVDGTIASEKKPGRSISAMAGNPEITNKC
jgi:hypothetical protein